MKGGHGAVTWGRHGNHIAHSSPTPPQPSPGRSSLSHIAAPVSEEDCVCVCVCQREGSSTRWFEVWDDIFFNSTLAAKWLFERERHKHPVRNKFHGAAQINGSPVVSDCLLAMQNLRGLSALAPAEYKSPAASTECHAAWPSPIISVSHGGVSALCSATVDHGGHEGRAGRGAQR